MHIKAVFFDLFETLITEFSNGRRVTNRSINYSELLGMSNDDFKREWGNRHEARMTGALPNYSFVIKDIMEKQNLNYDDESAECLYQKRIEEKIVPFLNIRADVIYLLESLRKRNLKLGLISNCTEEEVRQWHECELANYFDDVIFSYEVGLAKPDNRIYALACERLNVKPENSVFVGDGGSNELDGACNAGLHPYQAIWFNTFITSNYKKLTNPEEFIQELEDLASSVR